MVKMLRVDERLLHGQVAVTWVNDVAPDAILVANDEIMQNEMGKLALKMAKPASVKLAIKDMDGAVELLKDSRSKGVAIFIIVRTVKDALYLVEKTGTEINHVNIGGIRKKEGGKSIAPAVFVTDDDIKIIRQLSELVEKVEFKMVPSDSGKSAKSLLKEV